MLKFIAGAVAIVALCAVCCSFCCEAEAACCHTESAEVK